MSKTSAMTNQLIDDPVAGVYSRVPQAEPRCKRSCPPAGRCLACNRDRAVTELRTARPRGAA
jgi:hypothetical protein